MNKVCIVTVYNSINSGSFWQAFVLGECIRRMGYDVSYIRRKGGYGSSNTFNAFLRRVLKRLIRSGLRRAVRETVQYCSFLRCQKDFRLKENLDFSDIQCVVLGSDTIWNIENKYFLVNRKKYWGGEFNECKVITYGVSVGNTSKEKIYQYDELFRYVENLYAISVRDKYTREIVSKMTDKVINIVCDPTLLWDKKEYSCYAGDRPLEKYIFLYLFKPLSSKQFEELRKFAYFNNLQIVDSPTCDKRADIIVTNEPYNFLRYIHYADYVVTDTYHGTVFSTNFEKQFVVVERHKNKVIDFLERMSLLDRLVLDGDISDILNEEINYERIKNILEKDREESINYLSESIIGG